MADNKAAISDSAQIYLDEHNFSTDPAIQGRVWAYEDFLTRLGRPQ